MRLDGQSAIVTGGSRGIGRAIVDKLANEGASVTTCGRGDRPGDLPAAIHWVEADVSKSADCQRLIAENAQKFGKLSLLVNNAGVQIEKTVVDSTDEDWDLLIGINCQGVFNMARAAIPEMLAAGGSLINIGSISGNHADPAMALYNASKAFVHGLTRSMAIDHGPRIRCNAVCPGWIMTGMADAAFAQASDPKAAKSDARARHAVGRFGQPQDIANMVAWLASADAAFVSGQCLTVDGGLTAASPLQPGLF